MRMERYRIWIDIDTHYDFDSTQDWYVGRFFLGLGRYGFKLGVL